MALSSSFFGSTFNKLVSLTVVFGAVLNLDFSAKSGFEVTVGATAGEEDVSAILDFTFSSLDGAEASDVSASDSSDATLLFFLIHLVDGLPGQAEALLQHGPSSSAQAQRRAADFCCS